MAFSGASSVSLIRSSRPAEGFGEPTVWVRKIGVDRIAGFATSTAAKVHNPLERLLPQLPGPPP